MGEKENILSNGNDTGENIKITRKLKKVPNKILWFKKHLKIDKDTLSFKRHSNLTKIILDLETPYDFFKYFMPVTFIQLMVDQTNLYRYLFIYVCINTSSNKMLLARGYRL